MSSLSDFIGGGGGTLKKQEFTTSGTWTHPDPGNPVAVRYTLAGSGAGGGDGTWAAGGGAEINEGTLVVTQDLNITIGAGGAGASSGSGGALGSLGSDSDIDSQVYALGGGRVYIADVTGLRANPTHGGGFWPNSPDQASAMSYGQGSPGGGASNSGQNSGAPTKYAQGGTTDSDAGGGGASFGPGGDGSSSSAGGAGTKGGGGGTGDGGGAGGDGYCLLAWEE